MADDTAKEDLNSIVQAIGFGIVGDFKELRQAMYGISAEMDESNRLLGNVNQNLESTNRSLDQLERDVYRQIDARQFRQLENQLEAKNKKAVRRQDEIMRSVLNAVNDIKRQAGGVRMKIDSEGNVTEEELPGGDDAGGRSSGGSFLTGAVAAVVGAAAIGGAAYMMSSSASADSSGAQQPSNPPPAPPMAPTLPTTNSPGPVMTAPSAAAPPPRQSAVPSTPSLATPTPPRSNVNLSNATQAVSAIATTAKSKALAKVQTKSANWFSRNGGRIVETIGPQYLQAFGKMIGGRFSFNKYMSDDSWTDLGLAFLNGDRLPDVGQGDPNITYVAQVVVNLAIQAYLISREIYSEENASEITSNLVPNFDEVEDSDRRQVVKNVGASLENYVNFLIDRSRPVNAAAAAASAAITPPPSNVGGGLEPPQTAPGAGYTGGGPTGSPPAAPSGGGGGSGDGGGETPPPANVGGGGGGGGGGGSGGGDTDSQSTAPAETPAATSPGPNDESSDAEVTPSDTTGTFSTNSDQAGGIVEGSLGALKEEIASGEGDYGAYNRGKAGDTPKSKRTIDIQNLTVGEVMQLQSQGKLLAVGKYQFIPGTLSEAVQYTGVDPGQKFDAATQEQLFPYLISAAKRPRLASYLSGESNNEDAALNDLAHEFASIPMSNGRGAYDGDRAGNAAAGGVRRAQKIKGILRGIRQSNVGGDSRQSSEPAAMAAGGVITPLPSDRSSSNMSAALAPINDVTEAQYSAAGDSEDGDTVSSSVSSIDARKKGTTSNPYDDAKNKISYYSYLMQHHFGNLKDDMRQAHEEVTSDDYHFGRAMDPLA